MLGSNPADGKKKVKANTSEGDYFGGYGTLAQIMNGWLTLWPNERTLKRGQELLQAQKDTVKAAPNELGFDGDEEETEYYSQMAEGLAMGKSK